VTKVVPGGGRPIGLARESPVNLPAIALDSLYVYWSVRGGAVKRILKDPCVDGACR
jgi:hypothetical protein